MHRQLGDGPVALDRCQRHLRLEPRTVLLPCPLHVLLPRYPRFLGAGLHLSHLSHFRGPAQSSIMMATVVAPFLVTEPGELAELLVLLVLVVGIIFLLCGLVRLGFVIAFISHSDMTGF